MPLKLSQIFLHLFSQICLGVKKPTLSNISNTCYWRNLYSCSTGTCNSLLYKCTYTALQNQLLVSLATQTAKSSPAWCSAACTSFQVNWKIFGLGFRTSLRPVQATGEADSSFADSLIKAIVH